MNAGSLGLTSPNVLVQRLTRRTRPVASAARGPSLTTGNSIIASRYYAGHGLVQDARWTTPGYDTAVASISEPRPMLVPSPSIRRMAVTERLYRSSDDRMLAGVAGGLA
jgi:hypothetical protein